MSTPTPDPTNMSGQSDVPVRTDTQSKPRCAIFEAVPGVNRIIIPAKKPNAGRPYYHENCELISATVDGKAVPLHVLFPEGSFKGKGYLEPSDGTIIWMFHLLMGLRTKTSSDDSERLEADFISSVSKEINLTFRHRFTQHFAIKSKPTSMLEAMVYEDEEVLDEQFSVLKFDQVMLS